MAELDYNSLTPEDADAIAAAMEGDLDFDEVAGSTHCPEGCVVEPDGTCPHGWRALALRISGWM